MRPHLARRTRRSYDMSSSSCSSDGEFACGEVRMTSTPGTPAPSSTKKNKGGKDKHKGHLGNDALVTSNSDSVPLCCVCCRPGGTQGLEKCYRSFPTHAHCWNAIRSFTFMLKKKPELREVVDEEFATNMAVWRQRVLPLVTAPGERRTTV